MSSTTIGEQARRLQKTPELLLEQLAYAGVNKTDVNDELTETDQIKLLGYLQRLHGNVSGEPRKIKIVKKSSTEIKPTDSNGRVQTIQVEVRKKRTFIQRDEDAPKVEKLKIERIQAKAFKAFRDFDFSLQGRNLLVYGGNGAGKSSLYWLLYTFLQSGQKPEGGVTKYFDTNNNPESLLNVHATDEERNLAHITLSLKSADGTLIEYPISTINHQTKDHPEITKANLASDFVTYRSLSNFYNFSNSKTIDLWPVFEKEILPFIYTPNPLEPNLGKEWEKILQDHKVLKSVKGGKAKSAVLFDAQVEIFNRNLKSALDSISKEAQKFYDKHFSKNDVQSIKLVVIPTKEASPFDLDLNQFTQPEIGFGVKLGQIELKRPHTFLNEAKLTQLALSVRFGATVTRLQDSALKLLVLDDLLISLDMNNRIPVVDIILGEDFKDYQKIILTHDIGFFKEFRRRIGRVKNEWSFQQFTGNAAEQVALVPIKTDLEKARQHFSEQKLDEAANALRKAAEEMAINLRVKYANKPVTVFGKFQSLSTNLRIAKNSLAEQLPHHLYERIQEHIAAHAFNSDDLKVLKILFDMRELEALDNAKIIDDVLLATERVLNPGSHAGDASLYEAEVKETLELVEKFLASGNALLLAKG